MKTKTFQLKEILPNPFRDLENNPLVESVVDTLVKSIDQDEHKDLWQSRPLAVRINEQDRPELVFGHHTLAALRRLHPSAWEIECAIEKLTDGQMISRMARENATRKSIDIQTLFEAIRAAVETYGAGKISVGEGEGKIAPASKTNTTVLRYAPSYSISEACVVAATTDTCFPYTVETLATFLGFIQPNGQSTTAFIAAFGALELIKEGYLTEARIKGLEVFKIAEIVAVGKQQRKKAQEEAARKIAEAKRAQEEAERQAAAKQKAQEEAEARRKAAAEAERLAAIKRAEEKAKRDAEEKIRVAAEAKRREEEAKQQAIAEEKRKKEEAERRAAQEAARKIEEEKQRKMREAQQAEAKKRAEEAERQRQIALAKAKKEEDERKAAQMIRDAEAAKARADAEAKRKIREAQEKEIAAQKHAQAEKAREEAAARKREQDEKDRQAAAAKKRAEDAAREAAQRKAQQEVEARKEAERAEAARLKIIADKKAADAAIAEAKRKADAAAAEAKRKDEEAKKEEAAAKARAKAISDKTAAAISNMTRKDIRENKQEIVAEVTQQVNVSAGRHPAPRAEVSMSEEKLRQFMNAVRSTPQSVLGGKNIPKNVVAMARELISAGRKILAQKKHPDAGGSETEMMILNAAHQWLTLLINQSEEK